MVKLKAKYLHSPDLLDLQNFGILVEAAIGPAGEEGEEVFSFLVCTPQWVADKLKTNGYEWGRHYLFVSTYNYAIILQAIEQICGTIEASDWEKAATILGRYGQWEFEDYHEFEDKDAAGLAKNFAEAI